MEVFLARIRQRLPVLGSDISRRSSSIRTAERLSTGALGGTFRRESWFFRGKHGAFLRFAKQHTNPGS